MHLLIVLGASIVSKYAGQEVFKLNYILLPHTASYTHLCKDYLGMIIGKYSH